MFILHNPVEIVFSCSSALTNFILPLDSRIVVFLKRKVSCVTLHRSWRSHNWIRDHSLRSGATIAFLRLSLGLQTHSRREVISLWNCDRDSLGISVDLPSERCNRLHQQSKQRCFVSYLKFGPFDNLARRCKLCLNKHFIVNINYQYELCCDVECEASVYIYISTTCCLKDRFSVLLLLLKLIQILN